MDGRSPAQLYALIFGVILTAAGIAGFFWDASFAVGDGLRSDAVIGLLEVNAWHNIVHLLTGALGLAVAGSYGGARAYALAFGLIYIVVAILGFVALGDPAGGPESILGILPVNTFDNFLHLVIGIAGLGAYLATPAAPAPTTTAPA